MDFMSGDFSLKLENAVLEVRRMLEMCDPMLPQPSPEPFVMPSRPLNRATSNAPLLVTIRANMNISKVKRIKVCTSNVSNIQLC